MLVFNLGKFAMYIILHYILKYLISSFTLEFIIYLEWINVMYNFIFLF